MKDTICTVIGLIGGAIAALFGGWDTALQTLVIFMAIDYITGLVVAGVFHASPKTKTGALESKAGWKGLIRKGETLLIVLVACQLDAVIGGSFVRDAAIIGFFGQRGHLHRRKCRPDGSAHSRSHHQGHRHPQAAGRDARERQGLT